jgi:hypothetical protein
VSASVKGVRLDPDAVRQFGALEPLRRRRVAHTLEEMVAVVQISNPDPGSLGDERLHFHAAGVRVEYSIDSLTSLLTVHELHAEPYARAG